MKTTRSNSWQLLLSSAIALVLACGDPPNGPEGDPLPMTSVIQVTARTTGSSLDAYGYRVTVDGSDWQWIGINATRVFGAVTEGEHTLELTYVAPNCAINGANPQTVEVGLDDTSSASFEVECSFVPRELAFTTDRDGDGNEEIYAMDVGEANPVRLTNDEAPDYDPAWSPDGTKLAFTTERDGNADIYVMDAGGANPVRLTSTTARDYEPAWSPDGRRILFTTERDDNAEIYVMDADGTHPSRLTTNAARDFDPAWSPGGMKIAFASDRSGQVEIYVMDADGTNVAPLTQDPGGEGRPAWSPAWSPDGTQVAFSYGYGGWFGDGEVWVIEADGSNIVRLAVANSIEPEWSPDGARIAFSRSGGWGGDDEIWIMRADGANPVNVTPAGHAMSYAPAWAH